MSEEAETESASFNPVAHRTDDIRALMTALAKAQGEMKPATKARENTHFKSKYADLAAIAEAARPALAKNEIAWIQVPFYTVEDIWLETSLIHGPSGQYIKGRFPIPGSARGDSQKLGAAFTYARRFSIAMMVGIVSEDDDADDDAESNADRREGREDAPQQPSIKQREAMQWADWAPRKVASFKTQEELSAFEDKHLADLAGLRKIFPEGHAKVMDAIKAANEKFG